MDLGSSIITSDVPAHLAPLPRDGCLLISRLFLQAALKRLKCWLSKPSCQTILLIRDIAVSQDEHGAFCSGNGTNDDNNSNNNNEYEDDNGNKENNNNNNCKNDDGNDSKENHSNNSLSTEPTRSHGNFLENLANETSIPNSKSDQESFTEERSAVLGSSINQGFSSDNHVENSIATPADDQETEIEISRSSIQADSPDGDDAVLLTPARTRGWSLRTLVARLNLGWIESTL